MFDLCLFLHFSTQKAFIRLLGIALLVAILPGMLFIQGQGRALTNGTYAAAGPTFSIMPFYSHKSNQAPRSYFIYNLQPDAHLQDSIQVKNTGTARGSVKLYPVDAFTAQTSGMAFYSHDDRRRDVGAWISLSSEPITLDPGKSIDVPFHVNIPERVRPGQHYGGIIAEPLYQPLTPYAQAGSTSFGIHLQSLIILGVSITLPGKTIEQLGATDVIYDQQSHYQRVLLQLENTGTQMLHPFGSLRILSSQGKLLQNIPLKLNAFLPQTSIAYPVYMLHIALVAGNAYTAKIHLQYGQSHVLDYTVSFTIPLPPVSLPIPKVISNLVTPGPVNFFSRLTIWHFIIAAIILFIILTVLFFWVPRIYKVAIALKRRLRR